MQKIKIFKDSITQPTHTTNSMVGYMSGARKARNSPSITNNICNLGGPKKGGLITMQGRTANLYSAITNHAPYCCVQTNLGCIPGLAYLRANNLLTKNPQGAGGVPTRAYRPRSF